MKDWSVAIFLCIKMCTQMVTRIVLEKRFFYNRYKMLKIVNIRHFWRKI